MRRRFDDAVAELGELEIENSLTNQEVLEVIQRGELLTRLAKQVRTEALKLGGEAGLILIQIDSFESGVCLLYTSPSPRDPKTSRMPSSA